MVMQAEDGRAKRTIAEVTDMPRSTARSRWRTAKEHVELTGTAGAKPDQRLRPTLGAEPPEPKPTFTQRFNFLTRAVLRWGIEYLKHVTQRTIRMPQYPAAQSGRFKLPDDVKIALAADWGTGTESAFKVGREIEKRNPHVTIHMGDVYYSGTVHEYDNYFLDHRWWPLGSIQNVGSATDTAGTYVLNGNHEMYSGGEGYQKALGQLKQTTSYFCLENDHWRVIGIDTGYRCTRNGLSKLLFGDRTDLEDGALAWLRRTVGEPGGKPVILLSHHQWFSAFGDGSYDKLGAQLEPIFPSVALWFWGHEHRMAGYKAYSPSGKTPVRGRCIGHGGMPIELKAPGLWEIKSEAPVVFSDQRVADTSIEGCSLGYCGFATLELKGPTLVVTYVDEEGAELLEETWSEQGGKLSGTVRQINGNLIIHRPLSDVTI